jgi:hypothetical protein
VTYSDTGDNSIQIPALYDLNDAKDYTITFTAFIGGCDEHRSLTLSFTVRAGLCPVEIGPYTATDSNYMA